MTTVKLWIPPALYQPQHRDSLFELVKSKLRFEQDAREIDANIQRHIFWVDDPLEAKAWVLPHDWQFYYERNEQKQAIQFCYEANKKGKTVLSFSGGDQGITPPVHENTLVYRQSGYRSKRKPNERTAPFFLSDPITIFLGLTENDVLKVEAEKRPIVGFCGMAPHGLYTGLRERGQVIYRNLKSAIGLTYGDQQEVISSSNLRYKTLEAFRESAYFQDKFIIRQKYRGGIQTPENRRKTTEEYYQNQMDSDLVVCVRGVGNFSLRFYETLAMGRIPIFIDTDSPLPDISPKNWGDYIIWVDRKDAHRAPEIAHEWLSERDLRQQQRLNRKLWVEHFRLDNFWMDEINKLDAKMLRNIN